MFKKILFPTDFSEYARKTLECGTELRELGAEEVVLVHVKELPIEVLAEARPIGTTVDEFEMKIKKEIEEELHKEAEILREKGIKTKEIAIISQVDIGDKIIKIAEDEKVDLILIGSRGKGWLKKKLLGSVSEEVLMSSKVPVLMTNFRVVEDAGEYYCEVTFTKLFDRILFPCDFSEFCQGIADDIKEMSLAGGKEVVFLHVAEGHEDVQTKRSKFDETVKALREKFEGIKLKEIFRVGNPIKEIIKIIAEERPTIVVIAARGEGKSDFGTTVDAVVRRAEIPVFVFK